MRIIWHGTRIRSRSSVESPRFFGRCVPGGVCGHKDLRIPARDRNLLRTLWRPRSLTKKRIKRPRDPIALAKLVGDIATGQVDESELDETKAFVTESARRAGSKGGRMRAEKLTSKQRQDIARNVANKRWKNTTD